MTAPLPTRVTIREEGPRDGWQNVEDLTIPTDRKVRLIERLLDAGVERITVGAMVHPRWVPQLADTPQVLGALRRRPGVRYGVLVPNQRGYARLREVRDDRTCVDEICVVVSCSESHNRSNVNMRIDDSLRQLEPTIAAARADGLAVNGGMACVFGCSYEGRVAPAMVGCVARALVDMGADELVLGDTTGMANPRQVGELLALLGQQMPRVLLTPHFHNTRGVALANVIAALQVGISSFESAYGELGGCQFARGATGNVATEDLVAMLEEMGIDTGIDLGVVLDVATATEKLLGRRLDSHLLRAGPVEWHDGVATERPRRASG